MTKILIGRSDVDLDYPVCRPSLDLDFTQEELDPRITFTRGSIGTRVNRNRVIETVDANQPRFDYDPVTGECKGLLIEESRSNLLTYSEDMSNVIWNKSDISVSTNQITAPDGTVTANKIIIGTGVNVSHIITQTSSTITAGNTVTFSVFVKYNDWSNIRIQVFGNTITADTFQARFNIQTGTFVSSGDGGSATLVSRSITPFPNGWYRCSVTGIVNNTDTSVRTRVAFMNTSGSTIFTGDGVSSYYLWGAQLEAGAFPTSYIPTTASTVPRTADVASMTGTNFSSWYNQNEGTIYVNNKILYTPNPNVSLYFLIFGINAGNRHSIEQTTANGLTYITQNSGGIQYWSTSGSGVLPANTNRKTTYAYSSSNSKTLLSGTSNQTYTFSVKSTTDVYKSMTTMYIGRFNDSLYFLNGTISRLTYYPRALKPNQLQYLTQ